ncbi:MAG: putrescine ABC transporter permease PotI [Cupriavidus sp.]|uniref:Ornithine carbamoyltransferase n=2 Tax=Methylobacterium TaxID=407 RepID=A0A089NST8_9HYPH|nr:MULTISPECIES: ABC transporter permease subunit [Methylobacterium]MBA9061948.1 putrescine transport system permease protein [Methylobacterium fujisawaense]MBU69382.1 putrescine ABC transporter permease PotI [Cupriavidus sp.]AIQ90991.1 Ornithine carbamoyltransferase [Methylobacterium oryzae CBMB20]MBP30838.1 putrescine ABC transporter permease PotI [Methylobacterium sp.]MDE4912569.1 ABC transporter permease subunit [Methylobacterium sp. 092160098-2]
MTWVTRTALAAGLVFLYAPIVVLIVYSFNASPLVTVWGGFSTRWYGALMSDAPLIAAAWVSLKVAILASLLATILGTLAALVLERQGRFRGRALFTGLVVGPIVMPEVMIGLSLLLMFIGIGLDRGLLTIVIAHTTFCTGFVAVVVGARLRGLDRSLEEAAADLGATPARVLMTVTLPLLAPALTAGALLAFTLSLDDLVIASFVSGPGSTTLPMRLYSQVRLGVNPEINAASTLLVGLVSAAVLLASWLTTRRGQA